MKQSHKRLLAAVLVALTLAVGFTGGYLTARYHYLSYINETFQIIRDGRPWDSADEGINVIPRERSSTA